MSSSNKIVPPCSTWNVWRGPEIEGTANLGESTLFIRSLKDFPNLNPEDDLSVFAKSKCVRVWFCKEFTDWRMIEAIGQHFKEICIEVTPQAYSSIPQRLRTRARIYLKVQLADGLFLKAGDFVCVGPAFSDEAFMIGRGKKVSPNEYLNDVKIS